VMKKQRPGTVNRGSGTGRATAGGRPGGSTLKRELPAYRSQSHFVTLVMPIFSAQPSSCRNDTSCQTHVPTSPPRASDRVDDAADDSASNDSDPETEEEPPLMMLQLAELAERSPAAMVAIIMAQAVEVRI
jgi:hypothetical protein